MLTEDRWLLPEGIEEVLPAEASRLEVLRRQVLDLFESWGYRQVMTPMIEYIESLLVGTGHDLDLQTFKLIDQISGRLMGVRADMTPQVARIDARNGILSIFLPGCVISARCCIPRPTTWKKPAALYR